MFEREARGKDSKSALQRQICCRGSVKDQERNEKGVE